MIPRERPTHSGVIVEAFLFLSFFLSFFLSGLCSKNWCLVLMLFTYFTTVYCISFLLTGYTTPLHVPRLGDRRMARHVWMNAGNARKEKKNEGMDDGMELNGIPGPTIDGTFCLSWWIFFFPLLVLLVLRTTLASTTTMYTYLPA